MNKPVTKSPWKAIAAMALNRVIGDGPRIPWHLPEDFRWFKQTTLGGTLLMGRRTYESIGRPLPGRTTVVLSRCGATFPGTRSASSLQEVAGMDLPAPVFLCGGAELYAEGLPRCEELLLTRVKREVAGNVLFPPFEHLFEFREQIRDTPEFTIERWVRRPGS